MTEFVCGNCNKNFTCKRNLNNHIEKKNDCKQFCVFTAEIRRKPQNCAEKNAKIIKKDIQQLNNNKCNYCNKEFSRHDVLKRHIDIYCKVKKEQKEEKEIIFKQLLYQEKQNESIKEQNKELQNRIIELINQNKLLLEQQQRKDSEIDKKNEQIIDLIKEIKKPKINKSKCNIINSNSNNNSNNNNTINNTVNIQIAQFGKENFNEIDKKHFEKIIRNPRILGVKVPEEILKMLHFNPDYPQFQNFYVSDFNRDRIMVHDGNTWILETPDKIKSVLEQIITFSKEKLEEYKDKKLSDEVLNRLKRIEEAINKYDDDFIADLKEMAEETESNIKTLELIKNYEQFQKEVLDKLKKISYNEGKKIIKFYN
jgi:hypothetical protein